MKWWKFYAALRSIVAAILVIHGLLNCCSDILAEG